MKEFANCEKREENTRQGCIWSDGRQTRLRVKARQETATFGGNVDKHGRKEDTLDDDIDKNRNIRREEAERTKRTKKGLHQMGGQDEKRRLSRRRV